jgi:hypothetical protein
VHAARDVGAQVIVPMPWGTFWLFREPAWEPIERTLAAGWPPNGFAGTGGTCR